MADLKAVTRRFYADVVNQGNFDLIDEIAAENFVDHEEFPGFGNDREGAKQFFAMIRTAFPDLNMAIEDMVAEGDRVVVRVTMSGTHQGEFMGIPATGKRISVPTIDIMRFDGEKVAEHWGVTDTMAMMQQLGAMPDQP